MLLFMTGNPDSPPLDVVVGEWILSNSIPKVLEFVNWKMLFPDSLFTLGISSDRLLLLHVDPSFFQFPKFFPSKPANFCLNPHCFIPSCSTILSMNCYFLYFWTSSRVSASLVCHVLSQIVFFYFRSFFHQDTLFVTRCEIFLFMTSFMFTEFQSVILFLLLVKIRMLQEVLKSSKIL